MPASGPALACMLMRPLTARLQTHTAADFSSKDGSSRPSHATGSTSTHTSTVSRHHHTEHRSQTAPVQDSRQHAMYWSRIQQWRPYTAQVDARLRPCTGLHVDAPPNCTAPNTHRR